MKLYTSNGTAVNINESKEFARGGEGRIIDVGHGKAAKIYHQNNADFTAAKLQHLSGLDGSVFIKPEEILFYKNNKVAGFIMKMLPNDFFPLYSAYSYNFCTAKGIVDKTKLKIIRTLIDSLNFAHSKGIVIGDFNPFNIMLNDIGTTFFIDTDSYQTPGSIHSGKLLVDIRDHLKLGAINKESDYYALSVVVFNFLTNIHPYKGTHAKYKSLPERAMQKITVFDNDPNLIVPKCYHPIQDKNLMNQFKRIFKDGERFPISLDDIPSIIHVINIDKVIEKEGELTITQMLRNVEIRYINCSSTITCVALEKEIIVYSTKDRGFYKELGRIPRTSKDLAPLPTDKNLFVFENGKFFKYDLATFQRTEMEGMKIENMVVAKQYGNIFVIIEEEKMTTVYLDETIGTHIKFRTKEVFGRSFKKYNGMMQNFGENTYLRVNNNGNLDTVIYNDILSDVYQNGNIGIAQTVKKGKVNFDLFRVNGLNVEKHSYPLTFIRHFGYNPGNYIIMPEDNQLVFLGHDNLEPLAKFKCSIVDEYTQVFYTKGGILLNDSKNLYMVNKK
jgi:serine/threonine protein kinase